MVSFHLQGSGSIHDHVPAERASGARQGHRFQGLTIDLSAEQVGEYLQLIGKLAGFGLSAEAPPLLKLSRQG